MLSLYNNNNNSMFVQHVYNGRHRSSKQCHTQYHRVKANDLLHKSQLNRRSTLCARWCTFWCFFIVKDFLQTSNVCGPSIMCALMYPQITLQREWFIAHTAGKWTLPIMCALMFLQICLQCERHFTYITLKWPLSIMCAFMYLQVILPFERRFTDNTCIWTLSTVCGFM
jgi:hypothetical protein